MDAVRIPPSYTQPMKEFFLPTDEAPPTDSAGDVFTGSVLNSLRHDIQEVYLPSWLEKPPSNIGEAGHGKLKADHWRTLCTVYLVITLGRLWGPRSTPLIQAQALENFMHLIAAVDLATRRSMDTERANLFDAHMEAYLKGLRSLYGAHLVPNHHLSLHLKECLLLFGPTHGWWAFPFERYNGLLQRLKTNHKACMYFLQLLLYVSTDKLSAEMPGTFIRYFYLGAALRWMMDAFGWPGLPEYQEMVDVFRHAFQGSRKGTQGVQDVLSSLSDTATDTFRPLAGQTDGTLPRTVYSVLLTLINRTSRTTYASIHEGVIGGHDYLSDAAGFVPSLDHNGVTYANSARGKRNSFILFSRITPAGRKEVAGQVSEIFYHTRTEDGERTVTEPFLLVKAFKTLSDNHTQYDPFLEFPDVPTWLCYNELEAEEHLIRPQDIVSHFAALVYTPRDIGRECVVVRSLDRVRSLRSFALC